MSLGCIFLYAGIIDSSSHPLPTGFLLCNGDTFDINTYPALYTFLNNSNKLPNLVKRYPVMYTPSPIGTIGGSENITMGAIPSHKHESGNLSLAAHSHNISNGVAYASSINVQTDYPKDVGDTALTAYTSGLQVDYLNNDNTVSGNFDSTGSNESISISIVNAYITINYIIKAS
jgi:microcystin-dependent protein